MERWIIQVLLCWKIFEFECLKHICTQCRNLLGRRRNIHAKSNRLVSDRCSILEDGTVESSKTRDKDRGLLGGYLKSWNLVSWDTAKVRTALSRKRGRSLRLVRNKEGNEDRKTWTYMSNCGYLQNWNKSLKKISINLRIWSKIVDRSEWIWCLWAQWIYHWYWQRQGEKKGSSSWWTTELLGAVNSTGTKEKLEINTTGWLVVTEAHFVWEPWEQGSPCWNQNKILAVAGRGNKECLGCLSDSRVAPGYLLWNLELVLSFNNRMLPSIIKIHVSHEFQNGRYEEKVKVVMG